MTELYKRIKAICEKNNFQNFTEMDDQFIGYRNKDERIYFNEYRTNVFELRKTGLNNIGDLRTWCNSFTYLAKDERILEHINWIPINGLTIDLAKKVLNKKIQWKLYNFLNKDEAGGTAIIKNVQENKRNPLEVQNIDGDDLADAFFDGKFFLNDLSNVIKYRNNNSYITYKEID